MFYLWWRDSVVDIATGYRAGRPRGRSSSPGRVKNFLHAVQTGSGVHRTCPVVTGGKAAGVWSWPLTSNYCRGQENVDLYIHSPHTSSWRSAQLVKHSDNFIFAVTDLFVVTGNIWHQHRQEDNAPYSVPNNVSSIDQFQKCHQHRPEGNVS
jgi:hypothetical protein